MKKTKSRKLLFILLATCLLAVVFGMAFTVSATSSVQETEFNKYLFILPGATGVDGGQQRSICFAARLPGAPELTDITFRLAEAGIVKTTSERAVVAYIAQDDYSDETIEAWDKEALKDHDVTQIHPGTARYNCHSYAWHQASDTNNYYIGDISVYLSDPHCTEISNAAVGAIVVYYDAAGNPLHSAIVKSVTGGIVTCWSKWGVCGVFEHELNEVPSDYMDNGFVNEKYYMYERSHTYSDENAYTATYHTLVCAVCDHETTVQHSYTVTYTTQNHTMRCTECAYETTAQHSYTVTYTAQNHTTRCTACDYKTTVQHSYTVTHTALNHTRSCRFCNWSKTEPHTYDSLKTKCTICGRPAGNTPVQPFRRKTEKVTINS